MQRRAGGMCDRLRTDRHQRQLRIEPRKELRLGRLVKPHQAMAANQRREIAMLQRRADHPQIRLEDAENRLVAGPGEERLEVITQSKSKNIKGHFLFDGDGIDEPAGFVERLVSAVEIDLPPIRRAHGQRRRPRFARLDRIRLGDLFHHLSQRRLGRPKGREIRHQRGIRRGDENSGCIGACGHGKLEHLPQRRRTDSVIIRTEFLVLIGPARRKG